MTINTVEQNSSNRSWLSTILGGKARRWVQAPNEREKETITLSEREPCDQTYRGPTSPDSYTEKKELAKRETSER